MGYEERTHARLGRSCAIPFVAGALAAAVLVAGSLFAEIVTHDERQYLALALQWVLLIGLAAVVGAAVWWAARPDAPSPTATTGTLAGPRSPHR